MFRFIDKGLGFRVIIVRTGEAGWIESLDFYEICLRTIGETSRTNTHHIQEKRAKPYSLNPKPQTLKPKPETPNPTVSLKPSPDP